MKTMLFFVATAVLASMPACSQRALSGTQPASPLLRLPRTTRAGETSHWGHIKSLVPKSGRFEMRFDPGLPLRGTAAEEAAFEDTGSRDVPNDVYVVEEGHRVLTFVVPTTATATLLITGPKSVAVPVRELVQLLRGKNPKRRPLFGRPRDSGFWIRVGVRYPNAVLSIDQQYQP
jgi:hypothetical protein